MENFEISINFQNFSKILRFEIFTINFQEIFKFLRRKMIKPLARHFVAGRLIFLVEIVEGLSLMFLEVLSFHHTDCDRQWWVLIGLRPDHNKN